MEDEKPIMTKYEYTRVRGIRIQQLIDGMSPFVEYNDEDTYEDIFHKELKEGKIPLVIMRKNGFNSEIAIPVNDMNSDKYLNN